MSSLLVRPATSRDTSFVAPSARAVRGRPARRKADVYDPAIDAVVDRLLARLERRDRGRGIVGEDSAPAVDATDALSLVRSRDIHASVLRAEQPMTPPSMMVTV